MRLQCGLVAAAWWTHPAPWVYAWLAAIPLLMLTAQLLRLSAPKEKSDMKKTRFVEEQPGYPKMAEAGTPIRELCREPASNAAFYLDAKRPNAESFHIRDETG